MSLTGCFHALRAQSFLLGTVRQHEARIKDLGEQIREAEIANDVPLPIKEEQVESILNDLRDLWREDVAAVAPLFPELTGPVTVRVKHEEGKRRANLAVRVHDQPRSVDRPVFGETRFSNHAYLGIPRSS